VAIQPCGRASRGYEFRFATGDGVRAFAHACRESFGRGMRLVPARNSQLSSGPQTLL
jgi:hypothetical protein